MAAPDDVSQLIRLSVVAGVANLMHTRPWNVRVEAEPIAGFISNHDGRFRGFSEELADFITGEETK